MNHEGHEGHEGLLARFAHPDPSWLADTIVRPLRDLLALRGSSVLFRAGAVAPGRLLA
jgi:hypothetical protein